MGKEERHWKPSRWKPHKLSRYLLHVRKQACLAACQILGEYEGNKVAAQLIAEYAEAKSVAMLRAQGVALCGDAK